MLKGSGVAIAEPTPLSNRVIFSCQVNMMAYFTFQNDRYENCSSTCDVDNGVLRKSLCRNPGQDVVIKEVELEKPGRKFPRAFTVSARAQHNCLKYLALKTTCYFHNVLCMAFPKEV